MRGKQRVVSKPARRRLRVLFVGMPDSVHLARWIRALDDVPVDCFLLPTTAYNVHPLLLEAGSRVRVLRLEPLRSRAVSERVTDRLLTARGWGDAAAGPFKDRAVAAIERHFPAGWRASVLAMAVRAGRFDVVHTLETQGAGYLYLGALPSIAQRPLWLHSNYGSDVSLFARIPEHRTRVVELLRHVDVHLAECCRDQRLVVSLGFRGRCEDAIPNGGGLDLAACALSRRGPPSTRRVIAVKGYQSFAGRALVALEALKRARAAAAGFSIQVFSAGDDVTLASHLLAADFGLDVTVLPTLSHGDMLRLHGSARVSLGLSISDAASTSLLEALAMGSFPIQSDTACLDEWITPGVSGLAVPAEDPALVAEALTRALTDDALVDRGAELNLVTAAERLDDRQLRPRIIAVYEAAARQLGLQLS
jgi:glycosyltransferase involved in cell wall biosynthesis